MFKAYKKSSFASGNWLVEFFLSLPRPNSRMCIRIYIFDFKTKQKNNSNHNNYKTKSKETEEEKIMSMENVTDLTGYDDIVCEYALCTFNLLDRDINFSRLFI